jgi:hypothetical protein
MDTHSRQNDYPSLDEGTVAKEDEVMMKQHWFKLISLLLGMALLIGDTRQSGIERCADCQRLTTADVARPPLSRYWRASVTNLAVGVGRRRCCCAGEFDY